MSDEPIHSGTFTIASFSKEIPLNVFNDVLFGTDPSAGPTYTLTVSQSFYRVRRRLARITPLMRRPRGRKLLGVVPITEQIKLYDVVLEQDQ